MAEKALIPAKTLSEKATESIEDLAKLEQGLEKVAAAIGKVAKLLKSVV